MPGMDDALVVALRRLAPTLLVIGSLAFGCSDDGPGDDDGSAGSAGSGNGSATTEGAGASGASGGQPGVGGGGATGGADSSCPTTQPRGRESCSDDGQVCEYGEECCCGQCFPSYSCVCSEDVWSCSYTDACFAPSCGGAGGDSSGRGGGI